jgi:hypothetical protein
MGSIGSAGRWRELRWLGFGASNWHTNSRTESISNLRLETLILFGFLEGDRTRLVWLRFHSESVEIGLATVPRRVHSSTQLKAARRASAWHRQSGPRVAAVSG